MHHRPGGNLDELPPSSFTMNDGIISIVNNVEDAMISGA